MTTLHDPQHAAVSSYSDSDTGTVLPSPEERPASVPTTSMAWMPLEGVAQVWATFAGAFLTSSAFMATSMAFSALSIEASALRHYSETCRCRFNGATAAARDAGEQTIQDLQDALSKWIRALYWLERLAGDEQHSNEEHAHLRLLFTEATEQWHRLSLLTFQVQETCVLLYQRTGILRGEGDTRPGRQSQGKRRSRDDE